MNTDGSDQRNLTPFELTGGKTIAGPVWSPDGSQIAFHQWHEFNQPSALLVIDADGSNLTGLGSGQNPSWLAAWPPAATRVEVKTWATIKMQAQFAGSDAGIE